MLRGAFSISNYKLFWLLIKEFPFILKFLGVNYLGVGAEATVFNCYEEEFLEVYRKPILDFDFKDL